MFTAYLLAASVVTPIAGRLGDMFGKKRVLVITLAGLAAGSLLAALVHTLPLMIAARTIQGLGGAIFPLAFGIVRDEFPRERVAARDRADLGHPRDRRRARDRARGPDPPAPRLPLAVLDPARRDDRGDGRGDRLHPRVDPAGRRATCTGSAPCCSPGWLVALLLAVSEASTWGWGSTKTIGLIALSAVVAAVWVWAENRTPHPLVDMRMMRLPGVWTTNLAALLIGFGMYSAFILIPQFVQTPKSTGYGFGASVSQAGVFLVPTTIMMLIFSPIGGRLSSVVGSKVPLVLGSLVTSVSFVVLALAGSPLGDLRRLCAARDRASASRSPRSRT